MYISNKIPQNNSTKTACCFTGVPQKIVKLSWRSQSVSPSSLAKVQFSYISVFLIHKSLVQTDDATRQEISYFTEAQVMLLIAKALNSESEVNS